MSGFSAQADGNKPANKLEFVTHGEAADLLGLRSTRTVHRYLRDPQTRKILRAIYHRGRWRIPRASFEPWPWRITEIKEKLEKIGKDGDDSVRAKFRRESGMGILRLERQAKILRLAVEKIERLSQKRRLTKRAKYEIDQVCSLAQSIASKYRCSLFVAPKFCLRFLTAQNNKEKKRNASQIKWLKRHGLWNSASAKYSDWLRQQGLWASAKALINSGEDYTEYNDHDGLTRRLIFPPKGAGQTRRIFFPKGAGHFEAVIGYQGPDQGLTAPGPFVLKFANQGTRNGYNFILPNNFIEEGKSLTGSVVERRSIHLSPVKTKAQIAREVRGFLGWWPSQKSIEAATLEYNKNWWLFDLERAAKECRRQKKPIIPFENLRKYMYRDEIAQWQGRPGISRSSYYRRHYSKADLARACRPKIGTTPSPSEIDPTDLAKMSIQTKTGRDLPNPYRDKNDGLHLNPPHQPPSESVKRAVRDCEKAIHEAKSEEDKKALVNYLRELLQREGLFHFPKIFDTALRLVGLAKGGAAAPLL